MTKTLSLPGLPGIQLRDAIQAGAASLAELEALHASPEEVWEAKTAGGAPHFRAAAKASKATDKPRTRSYVYSDERVDRHGDVLLAKGWDVANFASTEGPILWGHNHGAPPIGLSSKPVRKNVEGIGSLVGDVTFAEAEINPHADLIWRLVEAGFIKTGSVGFNPLEARYGEDITDKERTKYGISKYGVLFTAQELLEFSIVSVPANPGAREIQRGLKMLEEKGHASSTELDELVRVYPLTEEMARDRVRSSLRSFFHLPGTLTKAISELIDEQESEEEREKEAAAKAEESQEPEAVETNESPTEEQPAELEVRHDDSATRFIEAQTKLTSTLADLVDAITIQTEQVAETGKAVQQLADSAYTQLQRNAKPVEEAAVDDGDPGTSEGGNSAESEAGFTPEDVERLAVLAEKAKSLTKRD